MAFERLALDVDYYSLIEAVFAADLAAFHGQRPELANRYRAG